MASWHKYGKLGTDSQFRNLMGKNLASNEMAKMNKLFANNICVQQNVDICGNLDVCGNVIIDGTLDVSGHSQLCDVSACNVDISQNLRADASVNFTTGVINTPRYVNTTGNNGNVFIGDQSGFLSINPDSQNVGIGNKTLRQNTALSTANVGVGNEALENTQSGGENTAVGLGAGQFLVTGSSNLLLGGLSGRTLSNNLDVVTSFSNCSYIGANTHPSATTGITNETVIGEGAIGKGTNTVQIGNCDISDVYLGCDGSGTTLHVDNILLCDLSACNVDISQNLTVDASASFTAGRIDLKNTQILSEGSSSGRIVIGGQDNIGIGVGALLANPNNDDNNIAIGRDTLKLYNTSTAGRNVIIGGSAGNKLNGNSHSNVMVGFNAGSDLSLNSTDNVFLGRQSGSRPSGGLDFDISNCVGVGFQTLFDVSNNKDCIAIGHAPTSTTGVQNEIVIGSSAIGKGENTVQIGNCDISAVYLGCDGGGTTLHVDNIICPNIDTSGGATHTVCDLSACNVDISQNLTVSGDTTLCDVSLCNLDVSGSLRIDGVNIFENLPVQYMNKVGTLGGTVTITSAEVAEFPIINLKCQSGDGTYTFSLEDVDASDNPTIEGKDTTFGTDFPIVVSSSSCVIHLDLNISDGLTARTPGRVTWINKSIGGAHLTWDGDAWSVLDCFNESSILTTAGTPGGGNPLLSCDLSACNVDISQNLTVDGSANFTTGVINTPRYSNTTGISGNVFIGEGSGANTTNATNLNVGIGNFTLNSSTNLSGGVSNVAIGNESLRSLVADGDNVGVGAFSLSKLTGGIKNIGIGVTAGMKISGGADLTDCRECIFIGSETKASAVSASKEIVIGYDATGKGSNTVQIGDNDISAVYLGKEITDASGNISDISGSRLYTKELQCFDRSLWLNTHIGLGTTFRAITYEELFIKNFCLDYETGTATGFTVIVHPQINLVGDIATGNDYKMPKNTAATLDFEHITFVLNFYRSSVAPVNSVNIFLNGGSHVGSHTDTLGDIKRIKFQPSATLNAHTFSDPSFNKAANGQSCSIIWDNKYEKWRILNCNNVEIFS